MPDTEGASTGPTQVPAIQAQTATNLPPPEKFSGANSPQQAELWSKWFRRFERYRIASGLKNKPDVEQVGTLLYAMGECADDILKTLNIDEEKASYEEVKTALNGYYEIRRNVLVERAKFNKRIQQPGESVDAFIQDLYRLADDCEYSSLKNELIRDRIIVGVLDDALSDRLQSKLKLTLEEAVQMSRQAEARQQSKEVVRGSAQANTSTVNLVKSAKQNNIQNQPAQKISKCPWCGNRPHQDRSQCPAKNATCLKCKKRGHFQAVCRSQNNAQSQQKKKVQEIEDDEPDLPFLGEIKGGENSWIVQVGINDNVTRCKLDTGASVSVVSDALPWLKNQPLETVKQTLMGPGGTRLPVIGSFLAKIKYRQSQIQERVYVIKNQSSSLLSRRACVDLGLIQRLDAEVEELSTQVPNYRAEFPKLFTGLGKMTTEYRITLKADAHPVCLYTPRRIPHPLLPKVKEELERMIREGVISPVTEPTEWCSGIVPVLKPNGKVRICVDLVQLNKSVQREVHPMYSVDESLAKLSRSRVFSKLDANSGFWQLPLDKESRLLTTFITPYGRYCFNRLPFGISSAPEVFQRTMTSILGDLKGVICHIDDTLVHAETQAEHDEQLRTVLKRLQEAGVTLNEKCEFSKRSVKFLGHIIDEHGIRPDPAKTEAIRDFPVPQKVNDLQRFMGMVNQMAKFIPNLANLNEPLRQLLKKDNMWRWDEAQQRSFERIKKELVSATNLAHYDPSRPTVISSDASNFGLGAVLLQLQEDGTRKPVYYASRSLSETEKRYAVIEKEALAVTWACDKFSDYVLGMKFTVETDHKPLVSLFTSTDLSKMPPRILRFRMRLMKYELDVVYVPGKEQITADTLSRAPIKKIVDENVDLVQEVESFTQQIVAGLPATPKRLRDIGEAQDQDEVCGMIKKYCLEGWPSYMPNSPILRPYWEKKEHLTVVDKLLLYDDRIVIPAGMRLEILDLLHQGHLGITKMQARGRMSVWWPAITTAITDMVTKCLTCAKNRPAPKEPLMPSSFPSRPWERLAADLFDLKGKKYLIVTDYYSRWTEIKALPNELSESVIKALKEIFSTHGIPDLLVSDNGPQFACKSFQLFASNYGFNHVTSSPTYARGNGEVERAVRTVKEILKKNDDPYLGLLAYRTAPLHNGLAPCELLMSRQLRTQLPVFPDNLQPKLQMKDLAKLGAKEELYRSNQKSNHDSRYKAKDLPELQSGEKVWVRDQDRMGRVLAASSSPRSYIVETDRGTQLRRNRAALVSADASRKDLPADTPRKDLSADTSNKELPTTVDEPTANHSNTPKVQVTRSGRVVKPPQRLIQDI